MLTLRSRVGLTGVRSSPAPVQVAGKQKGMRSGLEVWVTSVGAEMVMARTGVRMVAPCVSRAKEAPRESDEG